MTNLPHQRNSSFPSKLLRPNASQTLKLLGSLAAKENRKISKQQKSLVPASALTNSKLQAASTPKTLKRGKFDLRPHRASVCPHMFVCLSSSRIWSTCGFWAGRGGLIFGTFSEVHFHTFGFCLEFVLELCQAQQLLHSDCFPSLIQQ